jgi:hypothetical protein
MPTIASVPAAVKHVGPWFERIIDQGLRGMGFRPAEGGSSATIVGGMDTNAAETMCYPKWRVIRLRQISY